MPRSIYGSEYGGLTESDADDLYVNVIGDTMTGKLVIQFPQTDPLEGYLTVGSDEINITFTYLDLAGIIVPYLAVTTDQDITHTIAMDSVLYLFGGNNTTYPKAKLAFIDVETPAATNIEYQGNIDTMLFYSHAGMNGPANFYFRDTDIAIRSNDDSYLDFCSDGGFRFNQNSNIISLSHDGTDAYCKWSDGDLFLTTDEGTNTYSYVILRGKGTGTGNTDAGLQLRAGDNIQSNISFELNNNTFRTRYGTSLTDFILNEEGADVNVRIESDTNANMFFLDAGNDKIYFGYNTYIYSIANFEITESGTYTAQSINCFSDTSSHLPFLQFIKSHSDAKGTLETTIDTEALGAIYFKAIDSGNNIDKGAYILASQDGTAGTRVPTNLIFVTASSTADNLNQLVLHNDGKIGIGTATPSDTLTISASGAAGTEGNISLYNYNGDVYSNYIKFHKYSPSPADDEYCGIIDFYGYNDNVVPEAIRYAQIQVQSEDVSDGAEAGYIGFNAYFNGASIGMCKFDGLDTVPGTGKIVFNEGSNDVNFIVCSASGTFLFMDASGCKLGVNTPTPSGVLEVNGDAYIDDDLTVIGELGGCRSYITGGRQSSIAASGYAIAGIGGTLAYSSTQGFRAIRDGSITGLSANLNVSVESVQGDITVEARVNDVPAYSLVIPSNGVSVVHDATTQARGLSNFNQDDLLQIYVGFTTFQGTIAGYTVMEEIVYNT